MHLSVVPSEQPCKEGPQVVRQEALSTVMTQVQESVSKELLPCRQTDGKGADSLATKAQHRILSKREEVLQANCRQQHA